MRLTIGKVSSGESLRHQREHWCYRFFCQGHGENPRPRPRNRRRRTAQHYPTELVLCSDSRRKRVKLSWMTSKSCRRRHPFVVPGALTTAALMSFCSSCCGASAGSITRYSLPGTGGDREAQVVSSSVAAAAAAAAASATGGSDGGESTTTADDVLESSANQWGGREYSVGFSEEGSSTREDADPDRFLYWDQGGTGGVRASEGFREEQRRGDGWRDVRSWRHEDLEQVLQELEDTDYGAGLASKGRHRKPRVGVPRSVRAVHGGTVRDRGSGADSRRRSITVHPDGRGDNRVSRQGMNSLRSLPFAASAASEMEETSATADSAPGGIFSHSFDNREPSEFQDTPTPGGGHINDSAPRYHRRAASTSTSTSQSMLLSGDEFSEVGSVGTGAWTDPDTEDFIVGNTDVRFEHPHHLAAYGCYPSQPRQGVAATSGATPGLDWPGRATNDQRPLLQPGLLSSSTRGRVRPTLDLDYSAKVLNYGRSSGIGPPKTLTLRSWWRLLGAVGIAAFGAFLSVSPNNAPRDEYLALFRRNLWLLAASLVGPALYTFLSYDGTKVNINTYVRVVTFAFTWGYLIAFALEIVTATAFQLCVLAFIEPAAFKLTPDVPAIFLPWVLRENGYIPSYLYSCVADLLCFCVASPIVECGIMVWVVRRLGALPERVALPIGSSASATASPRASVSVGLGSGDATRDSMECGRFGTSKAVPSALVNYASVPGKTQIKTEHSRVMDVGGDIQEAAQEPTHVHTYLQYMLGSAMGLKAACTVQRVLWYTKEFHHQKAFFALARGFFPLYELCGSILAMNLARRDILGERMNRLQLFFIAVSLNAYGVFRGAKPIFKWASSKPWDELMVKAWVFPKDMMAFQLVRKGFASVAWSLVVLKVTAHVIKTYWKLTRLHSSRLRQQHEMAAAAAEQRAAALTL